MEQRDECEIRGRPAGGCRAVAVLFVYCIHNAWNCWVFLNFTNVKPASELLGVSEVQISAMLTAGWVGILSTIPLVTVCTWHRTLLVAAGIVNACAPVLRYSAATAAASHGSLNVVIFTNWLMGAAFGIIGAWPPMLAAMQWPSSRHSLVTAVASLSNYAGGAAGVALMPLIAASPSALLEAFRWQACAAMPLTVMLAAWVLWLPPFEPRTPSLGLRGQLKRLCCQRRPAVQLGTFGLVIGLSLLLQGADQQILAAVGFTELECGVANSAYQLAAAAVGMALGLHVTSSRDLRPVLRRLHALAALAFLGLVAVCCAVRALGRFNSAPAAMVLFMAILGASLMGMLPFVLQRAVTELDASENVTTGLLYMIAVSLAAGLTEVTARLSGITSLALLGALLALEIILFTACDGSPQHRGSSHLASGRGLLVGLVDPGREAYATRTA